MAQKIIFENFRTPLDFSTKRMLTQVVKERLPVVELPKIVTYKNVCSYVHARVGHIYVCTLIVRVSIKKSLKGEEADVAREAIGVYGVDIFNALYGVKFPPEEEFEHKYDWVKRVVVYKIDIQRE